MVVSEACWATLSSSRQRSIVGAGRYVDVMTQDRKLVLVTDLDNTLWDWFAAWHASFSAMLVALEEDSGVPRAVLEREIRVVHQKYGTTEYSNLLSEVPSLINAAGSVEPWRAFPRAVEVLRRERRRRSQLYPGVLESLGAIRASGITIIAYTESLAYWTMWRIKRTNLDGVIHVLYSAPDHDLPRGKSFEGMRSQPEASYALERTEHRHVPRGVLKPNAQVLLTILDSAGFEPHQAVYIGDSLMKDVAMAQEAHLTDVHARYGEVQQQPGYDLLRRVSHWTDEDVERERAHVGADRPITATHICRREFAEILPILGLD